MKKEVILSMILPTVVATFHPYIFLIPHSMIPWMLMVNYHKEILEFCILRVVSTIGPDITTGSPSQPSPSTVPPPQNNPPPPPPNNQPFDPPEVPTFFNRTALFCWFISVLTAGHTNTAAGDDGLIVNDLEIDVFVGLQADEKLMLETTLQLIKEGEAPPTNLSADPF